MNLLIRLVITMVKY